MALLAVRKFDAAERRARLSERHLLAPQFRAADVLDAGDSVVAFHATDPATVFLSARARTEAVSPADVEDALYVERSLVKHLCMRRTLFVFRRELLSTVHSAAGRRVADQLKRRLVKDLEASGVASDGAAWIDAAADSTVALLARVGESSSSELRDAVPELQAVTVYAPRNGPPQDVPLAPRMLSYLSAAGLITRATNRANWNASRPAWTTPEQWLGARPDDVPEQEARADLVRRWLRAFGPATVEDLTWWMGSTLTAVRAALQDAGAVEVDLDGKPGVALSDDLDPTEPVEPYAALLPGLDPTPMGWKDRDWFLGPHRGAVFDVNGNIGPTAWWDGRIVGGWNQAASGDIFLQLLEDVGSDATVALEAEAERLTDWLGGVRVSPSFPSPLWRAGR